MIKKRPPIWSTILQLSRPAFWIYLAGPYLIGYTAASHTRGDFFRFEFWYTFFFFLIPANIILYGVNDLYDQDTDSLNEKKVTRETRVSNSNKTLYTNAISLSFITALPLLLYLPLFAKILLGVFLLLSVFYSVPPIRFKAKPVVDSLSNILYGFPAFIAVYQLTSDGLTVPIFVAVLCWTAAMHLFSAIPDREADKRAHLKTTAIMLGKQRSLIVCFWLWLITGGIAIWTQPLLAFFLAYPTILFFLIRNPRLSVETFYWEFPKINFLVGFLLFLVVVFT